MTLTQIIHMVIFGSIFLTVFVLGLSAEMRDATYLFRRPGLLFRSFLSMNVVMIAFVLVVVELFHLDPAVKIAIVALAVSPVPPIIPKKQQNAGGSGSYAIGLLVATLLLAIVLVPLSIELLGRYFSLDVHMPPSKVASIVMMLAIVPLVAGMLVHKLAPHFADRIIRPISLLATVLLAAGVLPILFTTSGAIWNMVGNGILVTLAAFTLVGLAMGHVLGGPVPEDRTVLALATSARHPGIAMAIAGLNFPDQAGSVLAVVVCSILVNSVLSIPYVIWRKRVRPANSVTG